MMQSMRNSAKIIFFVVLVAFAGFMILQGLVSIFSDPSRGGKAAPQGIIGEVDGREISVAAFEGTYRPKVQALYKENENEPSDEELDRIRNEVWNNLTTIASLENEAERHGIKITDSEVAEYMRQAPPQDILTSPDFMTNDQFDIFKYQAWLQQMASANNPQAAGFLLNFESQIRQQLMFSRLQDLVLSMTHITPEDARAQFIEKNEKVKVRYLFVPRDDFKDMNLEPSDQEAMARYESEKEQYKRPEQAILSYIKLNKAPSDEDFNEVKTAIDSLYKELKKGADFAEMAKAVSQDGSAAKGGDLDWFTEDRMVKPFSDATKALKKIGDISEPVKTQFGWHVIKLTGRRNAQGDGLSFSPKEGENIEYRASHILLKVEASPRTISELEDKMNLFALQAEKLGFRAAADEFGLTVSDTKPFGRGAPIPGVGKNDQANEFAFTAKPGEFTEVEATRNALSIYVLDKRLPAGYTPFEEVKDRIYESIRREMQAEEAYKLALKYVEEIRKGKSLDNIAKTAGKTIQEPDFFARHEFVPRVGSDPEFIGAAFRLSSENPVSSPVKSINGAYILQFAGFQSADIPKFDAASDSLTNDMISQKRRDVWNKWVSGARNKAEIKDYRSFYYGG